MTTYTPKFCVPTQQRIDEVDHDKSMARQEFDELKRQSGKTNQSIFAGRLIPTDELNSALNANS